MKRHLLAPFLLSSALMAGEADLQRQIDELKAQLSSLKAEQQTSNGAILEELATLQSSGATASGGDVFQSYTSLGEAASKVYHSSDALSIGGYGEYRLKKYIDYKNYADDTANDTRNKLETNILRFIPYFGYKFNDWIIMNTEIEFEDGGSRSDDENNYKYAIVEFSYLDFLLDESYNLRIGHVLVPMGITNLNHEPVAFLTADRPTVETYIIPSTWHTNGALMHGKVAGLDYYAGIVTSPDAGAFIEGRFIQQGRLGARQFTDDLSGVVRIESASGGFSLGGSAYFGQSTVLEEDRPGTASGQTGDAKVGIGMAEIHAAYRDNGWDIKTLAVYGSLNGDVDALPGNDGTSVISSSVNGQYLTVGYDLLNGSGSKSALYLFGEIERLDMDGDDVTLYPDNNAFLEYTAGITYYPTPMVSVKVDYWVRDYGSAATLADENVFNANLGFIF